MKNIIIILVLLLYYTCISQAQKCPTTRDLELIKKYNVDAYNRIMDIENHSTAFLNSPQPLDASNLIHIPVVVHVLYYNSTQNISDAQIQSQIAVLNEDYNRLNADKINTPSAFSGVAAAGYFDFFLACIDPNGNPTNGITRTQTSVDPFTPVKNPDGTFNETAIKVKYTSLGGYDAWPSDKYLNIWVCNLAYPIAGYTQMPGTGSTATDGVVIKYDCFGRVGTLETHYAKGRTATHEIGHWMNLIHIWGDDDLLGNQCSGSDFVDDTPNQQVESTGCPSFPHTDNCTTQSPGVMFMDYMDYTYDECMNLFTTGQVNRMRSLFSSGGVRQCFMSNTSIYRWCNSIMTFTGPSLFCTSGTYTVSNTPVGCTVSWAKSSNLTLSPGAGNTATFTANGNGWSWVKATVKSISCDSVVLPIINVWVGIFSGFGVSGQAAVCPNSLYTYTAQVPGGHSSSYSYSWTYPSGWYNNGQIQNTINLQTPQYNMTYGTVRVAITNQCGTSGYSGLTVYPGSCPHYFTIYPNPASDNITITMIDNSVSNTDTTYVNQNITNENTQTNFTVRVYNSQSALISSVKRTGTSFSVPLTNMRDGTYIVEVSDGKTSTTQTLIVKHN